MGYYGMEKEPKGVKSSDRTGEKMGSEKGANSLKGTPTQTGVKTPAGATASDMSGERKAKLVGGVAMGKEDATGKDKQFNTGRTEGVCYTHERSEYR